MTRRPHSEGVTTPEHLQAEAAMLARLNSRFEETLGGMTLDDLREADRASGLTLEAIRKIEDGYDQEHDLSS